MQITWLGHSGFRIQIEDAVLLIDPWLTGNPMFPANGRAEALTGATHILLTHAHGDHAGEARAIAQEVGAPIACIHEISEWLNAQGGVETIGFGKGGTLTLGGAKVTMVNATHSASIDFAGKGLIPGGSAAGFMIAGEGHVIYVTGDTDIMADMAWMGELHAPDIGILSCGGHYTMDMERAAWAARKYFNFRTVIPCHYRTFPILAQDAEALRAGLPPGIELIEPQVLVPVAFPKG
ncbi:metal-dependent hydrolase [Rhodobacter sp. Har01]|uniref:metal-dependent hydrolase n=1 Tax=Rhodobacter sp. Har01 TaxID=2883999 RepID=UPI001D06AA59|nr:metal-dependent hydrolase [Rhodobacter sp. Har01]MCB6178167.1 metal-dependent hydrolase [Rhodobacter sp. Har01]